MAAGATLAGTSPAEAGGNPYGPDHHADCTAGFASSQTLGGEPGAIELSVVARLPKSEGPASDVGVLSSTNCS